MGLEKGDAVDSELNVKISVNYEVKDTRRLKVSLTNAGSDFECYLADLPWSHLHSMTVIVALTNGLIVKPRSYIDDPFVGTRVIKKGETIEGIIELDRRFPDLTKPLARDALDLFWSAQVKDIRGHVAKRTGGWICLPRETHGERH